MKAFQTRNVSHRSVIQWGAGDDVCLKTQLIEKGMKEEDWIFGHRSFDVKTVVQSIQLAKGTKIQGGLKKNCQRFGVKFEGPAHDALQDAINTFSLYSDLLKRLRNL